MRYFQLLLLAVFIGNILGIDLLNKSFKEAFPPDGWAIIDAGTQVGDSWEQTDAEKRTGNYSDAVFYGPQGLVY